MNESNVSDGTDPVLSPALTGEVSSPLQACPSCDYAFGGLPRNHCCPECGLRYDERSRVWRPQRRFWLVRSIVVFGLLTPIAICHGFLGDPLSASLLGGVSLGGLEWTLMVVWFLLVLAGSFWLRFVYYNRYLVAILPGGLLIRVNRSKLIPWNEVASVDGTSQMTRVRRASGGSVTVAHFFADRYQMEAFESRVDEARWHYRQSSIQDRAFPAGSGAS